MRRFRSFGFTVVTMALAGFTSACDNPSAASLAPDELPAAPGEPLTGALTYEFGMKFEPPIGRVVHGMGQWVEPAVPGPAAGRQETSGRTDVHRPR